MERRSCCSLLGLALIASVAMSLIGYKHIQRELLKKLTSELQFSETSEKKTDLDLTNLGLELQNKQLELDIVEKDVQGLDAEVKKIVSDQQKMAEELKACQGSLATVNENIAGVEKAKTDVEGNFAASKTKWTQSMTDLQNKLQQPSPACAHLKAGTDANGQCPKKTMQNETKQENKKS